MSRSTGRRALTDLEANVLGLFWQLGPSTAYRIRRIFERSPTPHWSGSTGSIYPLVRRLASRRLLRAGPPEDRRMARLYSITVRGRGAIQSWFADALEKGSPALEPPPDTLRCHVSLLGVLTPARRRRFLNDAERRLGEGVAAMEAQLDASGAQADPLTRLAEEGALEVARVRLRWLLRVRERLED